MPPFFAVPAPAPLAFIIGPFGILGLSILFIVAAIALLRLHAFFALMLAAILVALLTVAPHPGDHRWVLAIQSVMTEFGNGAGKLGFTLALAAVIGAALMESGAADKIVRRMIAVFGEGNAAIALLVCGFLLSAPVFIDTVFMLLLPIARALSLRTGKNYLFYVLATAAGGVITNGTVPPAPGPLFVAEALKLNLGVAILAGVVFGVVPAIGALYGARWFNRRMPIAPRAAPGASLESLTALAERSESELPGFWTAIAPVVVPFTLIAAASSLNILHLTVPAGVAALIEFIGDKNIALVVGATLALIVHARQKRIGWRRIGTVLGPPLETAGIIILVISAGGAYGEMIKRTGLGDAVRGLAGGHAINYVLVAWTLAAVIRGAQGSATVAVITALGIVTSIAGPGGFGVHPLYILLAVGYGSKALAWMNDAGFWLISRVGGLTQGEALRSWSVLSTAVSLVGLIEVLIVSRIWPLPNF